MTQFGFLIWQEIFVWDDYFAGVLNDSSTWDFKMSTYSKEGSKAGFGALSSQANNCLWSSSHHGSRYRKMMLFNSFVRTMPRHSSLIA